MCRGAVLGNAQTLDRNASMNQRAGTPGHPLALERSATGGLGAEQPNLKVANGPAWLG